MISKYRPNHRRDHLEVLHDILELCEIPRTKTSILHSSNTCFTLLESYLLKLQKSNLLELEPETKKYFTTQEGEKFIAGLLYLKSLLQSEEHRVKNGKYILRNNNLIEDA